ncbi:MAG: hypothetical protein K0Q53_970, partial [Massilibacillus sp.]|nr:hypothetical protein [Massilibacillus sp.]
MKTTNGFEKYIKTTVNIDSNTVLPHKSISFKVLIIAFLIFMATFLGALYQIEEHIERTNIEVVKDELRSIAAITAFHMNGNSIEEIQKPEQE